MTSLHVFFTLRDQQAFQRLLESSRALSSSTTPGLSTSGGKSWNRPSPLNSHSPSLDINSRDWLGRTVLHLACSASDPSATEYVRLILAHPAVNMNIQDTESHWSALHRALYNGNLASALLLLQRSDTDVAIKDYEGHTAFDLYNSTVEHTKPATDPEYNYSANHVPENGTADLFTWGANRNAVLGSGVADDRSFPEQVVFRRLDGNRTPLLSRLNPVHTRQVAMSKLHTAVVTNEERNNIRVCGFGSGGRLGPSQHTQYDLVQINQLPHPVIFVALGQDHTLALTKSGEIYSWGLNRFAQLGYIVEQSGDNEQIQAIPKRISGVLKHKIVYGVAACKTASACFTSDELYTWGTNNGQLGYDKAANPVQVLPRLVARITQPVIEIAITDSAMACLLNSKEVICLWNDRHFKINFQVPAFPSDIIVYHPPQAVRTTHVAKITCCENTFGALSHTGEVFVFTPTEGDRIRPQRVWALRKQSSAVKDFALGSDGSIIICTESGHVFVRSRHFKGPQGTGKPFKFQRIPFVQRVVRVCANNTGAFGALKVDFKPEPIKVVGNTFAQDMQAMQPFSPSAVYPTSPKTSSTSHLLSQVSGIDTDADIQGDIDDIISFCDLLSTDRQARKDAGCGVFDGIRLIHGPDLIVLAQTGLSIPVHRMILSCRCPVLAHVLSGATKVVQDKDTNIVIKVQGRSSMANFPMAPLTFIGCQPLSVFMLLTYIYCDQVPALWDPRVSSVVDLKVRATMKVGANKIRSELLFLAKVLDLPLLKEVLEASAKRTPIPSMVHDFKRVFDEAQDLHEEVLCKPDVILDLADRQVFCHSALIRARSPLFAAFFDDDDWTVNRWCSDGTIRVNLTHLKWRAMQFVVRFLCCGEDEEMFEDIAFITSVDELLDLLFDVMAAANELLIDRLVSICSAAILRHININNVCSVFSDAVHYTATSLVERVQGYMVVNMETLLECHMLDVLSPALIRQLSCAAREKQARKSPYTRSTRMVDQAMATYADWLALQDIPQPIVRAGNRMAFSRDSVKLSPPGPTKKGKKKDSPLHSPTIIPLSRPPHTPGGDDIFVMDDDITSTPLIIQAESQPQQQLSSKRSLVWKAVGTSLRADMKSIMAEAEIQQRNGNPQTPPSSRPATNESPKWSPRTLQRSAPDSGSISRTPPGPVWKISTVQPSTSATDITVQPSFDSKQPRSSPSGLSRTRPEHPSGASRTASSSGLSKLPATPPRAQGKPEQQQQQGLGPVFNPLRQPVQKSTTPRRVSGGVNAWSGPNVKPIVNLNPGTVKSFAAIQLMQQEEDVLSSCTKQSLREIQEEEQARKAEQEFLQWWASEEERIRLEHEAAMAPPMGKKGSKKTKNAGSAKGGGNTQQRTDAKNRRPKKATSS